MPAEDSYLAEEEASSLSLHFPKFASVSDRLFISSSILGGSSFEEAFEETSSGFSAMIQVLDDHIIVESKENIDKQM